MRKNPEKPNKHVSKNCRSGKLALFPPNLLTKNFIIAGVIGSFFVVFDWQRRWHLRMIIAQKDYRLENQTLLRDDPILFHRMQL